MRSRKATTSRSERATGRPGEHEDTARDRPRQHRLERERVRRALHRVAGERGVELGWRGDPVGLPVDDDELAVGLLEQQVDETLDEHAVDRGRDRHLPPRTASRPRPRPARSAPASALVGEAAGSRPRARGRPRPAPGPRAVASRPAPDARSTVWSTACTARPTAVPGPAPLPRPAAPPRARPWPARVGCGGPPHPSARPARRPGRAWSPRPTPAGPRRRAAPGRCSTQRSRRDRVGLGHGPARPDPHVAARPRASAAASPAPASASSGTYGAPSRIAAIDCAWHFAVPFRCRLTHEVVAGPGHRDVQEAEPLGFVVPASRRPRAPSSGRSRPTEPDCLLPTVNSGPSGPTAPSSAGWGGRVFSPASTTIGNSSPFEPCTVRMRSASSSGSGATDSMTRARSSAWCCDPLDEPAQAGLAGVVPRPGLVEQEADAAPVVARAAPRGRELQQVPLADDAPRPSR